MSDVKLDEQDRENLKFILQTMYPNDRVFVEYEPNVSTLEVYVAAVKGNLLCNKAMTQLTTELAAAASEVFIARLIVKKPSTEGFVATVAEKNYLLCGRIAGNRITSRMV